MIIDGPALLVRIYIGESDRHGSMPLYQAVVRFLRERGIAGATALRGIEGYGRNARVHTTRILRLSEDLPVLVEAVDREDRIRAVLPELDAMVQGGLITLERVEVLVYRSPAEGGANGPEPGASTRAEPGSSAGPTEGGRP